MPKFKLFAARKGKADQAKNNLFVKMGREIYILAKKGGANPESNLALRNIITKAKQAKMPVDNIDRMLKKAAGANDGDDYEEIMYEGYGPGGVAIMVRCLTDNRNRTAADLRTVFNKRGGNMGETGCVSYMFDHKGVLLVDREEFDSLTEDDIMMQALEAGAEDVVVSDEEFEIRTDIGDFYTVKSALEEQSLRFSKSELSWVPQNTVQAEGENAEKLLRMMEAFEDLDDVQDVYANFDISDEEMEKIGG